MTDIQHIDVVQFRVADVYEGGNRSAQVEQSVQLDRSFGLTKWGPGKQRQAKVYGGGIQRIHGVCQIHCQRFVGIKSAADGNEGLSEFVVDAPVARLVGIGQRAAADVAAYAEVVKLGGLCPQTSFDVAQALAISKLGKGHAQKLVQTTEAADVEVATVFLDQSPEGVPRREFHHLGKNQFASVHRMPPGKSRKPAPGRVRCSSR
jgi:hypothetical protein